MRKQFDMYTLIYLVSIYRSHFAFFLVEELSMAPFLQPCSPLFRLTHWLPARG